MIITLFGICYLFAMAVCFRMLAQYLRRDRARRRADHAASVAGRLLQARTRPHFAHHSNQEDV